MGIADVTQSKSGRKAGVGQDLKAGPAPIGNRKEIMTKISWQTLGMLGALILVWAAFAITTDGVFLSPRNLALLSRQMAVTAIATTGIVLLIVAGQIDLSTGALAGLCGAVAALCCASFGLPVAPAILIALALGAALGFSQGLVVSRFGVPPFIVTLGGMLIFQGILLGLTKGVSIVPPEGFLRIGQEFLPKSATWALGAAGSLLCLWQIKRAKGFWIWGFAAAMSLAVAALFNAYQGLPLPVLLMLVLAFCFWVLAEHTAFGRQLYAIGGNRDAAFYAGVPINRRIIAIFTIMGAVSASAGIVLTARVGAASADAGKMLELDAIAAAVIGGTSLLGGRGSVWGAILGATVMASLDNGMSLLNTEAFWQPIIKGVILVAAVTADLKWRHKR
ncbi:MAG: xylH [Fibrobacteres bacterium]|nr:xylH [Fibrobacterota bacterium]